MAPVQADGSYKAGSMRLIGHYRGYAVCLDFNVKLGMYLDHDELMHVAFDSWTTCLCNQEFAPVGRLPESDSRARLMWGLV